MQELIKRTIDGAIIDPSIAGRLANFERKIKELKEAQDLIKTAILTEMEEKGIIKVETEELLINYIQPTDRESFDGKAFRKDHPDMYDDYIRITPVSASIRIKVK